MAYGNTAYSALADAVKAQCEIFDDDATEVAWKKVNEAVESLFGDKELAPQIGALVGAGEPGAFSREDLFDAWRRFFERMAARYPLVLVFEDIHWADDALLDFTEYLADWAQGPIMVLTLARPELFENRPAWGGGKRNAVSTFLDPLSADESSAMLSDLLAGGMTDDLERAVVERSEGNPLFVEEIVRKLIDDGVLRATGAATWEVAKPTTDVELPRSIQGLIATRLDGLPADEKAVMQDAAVVGRVFWSGAVATLGGRTPDQVRDALGRLRVKELVLHIDPPSLSGELEFTFRHALIRDGAYESLPKSLRAAKHEQVARWAQMKAGDRADEIAELIATHELEALRYFDELGDSSSQRAQVETSAFRWTRTAGDRANALGLYVEACRWYRDALRLGELVGAGAADRVTIARDLVEASFGSESVEESEQICRLTLELYEELGDERGAGWTEAALVMVLFNGGHAEEAEAIGKHAVQRLEPLGETFELASALRQLGQFYWRKGDSEKADAALRRAAEIAARIGALDVRSAALQDLGINLGQSGHAVESIATLEEAFELAKNGNDANNLQRLYNNFASTLADFGSQYRRALEIGSEGLAMAYRGGGPGWTAWIAGTVSEISVALGDLSEAEDLARDTVEYALASGDTPLTGMRHVVLAWILLLRGKPDEAEPLLAEAAIYLEGNREPQLQLALSEVYADAASARDDDDAALAHLRAGAEVASRYNVEQGGPMMLDLIRSLLDRGEIDEARRAREVLGRGEAPRTRTFAVVADGLMAEDPNEAVRLLGEACASLEEIGVRIDLARALLDLGRAERRAGIDGRASFERAREILVACDARACSSPGRSGTGRYLAKSV